MMKISTKTGLILTIALTAAWSFQETHGSFMDSFSSFMGKAVKFAGDTANAVQKAAKSPQGQKVLGALKDALTKDDKKNSDADTSDARKNLDTNENNTDDKNNATNSNPYIQPIVENRKMTKEQWENLGRNQSLKNQNATTSIPPIIGMANPNALPTAPYAVNVPYAGLPSTTP